MTTSSSESETAPEVAPQPTFPNRERVRLSNYSGRFQPSQGPVVMMVMGAVFVGVGLFLLAGVTGRIDLHPSAGVPPFVLWLMPPIFGVPGLLVFAGGLRDSLRAARARRLMRERPGDPWLADYAWDRTGSWDDTPRKTASAWLGFVLFGGFMVPLNWWAFGSGQWSIMVIGVCLLFDAIVAFTLYMALTWTARWIRYGRSRLVYESFPYPLGGTMRATLRNSRAVAGDELVVRLRCVEPMIERTPRRNGRDSRTNTVYFQAYLDEQRFRVDRMDRFRGMEIPIEFALPDDRLSTQISRAPIRYWELEATCETPGVDFSSSFPAPVYGPG